MSDSNRIDLSYVEEVTYGVTPSAPLIKTRITGESLHGEMGSTKSQELRSDRQVGDIIRNNFGAGGGVNFELTYSTFDDWLQAGLLSANWTALVTATITATFTASTTPTLTRAAGSYVTDGFVAGDWIKVAGFVNGVNNQYFKITNVVALVLTLANGTGGATLVETSVPSVIVLQAQKIVNGTLLKSYSIERKYNDLTNIFEAFRGMCIDQMSLSIPYDQPITGSFTFIGKAAASAVATIGNGSYTTSPGAGNQVLEGIDNVFATQENLAQYDIIRSSIALANNLRSRQQVGTLGPISVGTGTVDVTGTHEAYFATSTVMDKFLGNNNSKFLQIYREQATPKSYMIECPRIRYTAGDRSAGGINQDIIAKLAWTAYADPTDLYTIRVMRWAT